MVKRLILREDSSEAVFPVTEGEDGAIFRDFVSPATLAGIEHGHLDIVDINGNSINPEMRIPQDAPDDVILEVKEREPRVWIPHFSNLPLASETAYFLLATRSETKDGLQRIRDTLVQGGFVAVLFPHLDAMKEALDKNKSEPPGIKAVGIVNDFIRASEWKDLKEFHTSWMERKSSRRLVLGSALREGEQGEENGFNECLPATARIDVCNPIRSCEEIILRLNGDLNNYRFTYSNAATERDEVLVASKAVVDTIANTLGTESFGKVKRTTLLKVLRELCARGHEFLPESQFRKVLRTILPALPTPVEAMFWRNAVWRHAFKKSLDRWRYVYA